MKNAKKNRPVPRLHRRKSALLAFPRYRLQDKGNQLGTSAESSEDFLASTLQPYWAMRMMYR